MDIKDLTVGQAQELARIFGSSPSKTHPFKVGDKWLIRAVTHYTLGEISEVTDLGLEFRDASWVADSGRYGDALEKGASVLKEVERRPDGCFVSFGAIVDADRWSHDLPESTK